MTKVNKEKETPENPTEPTVETKPQTETPKESTEEVLAERDAKIAELEQEAVELQKQKEHWRNKYERDIPPEPAPPEVSDEVFSDEGKALEGKIKSVEEGLASLKKSKARSDAEAKYPVLKDKVEEFDDFLEDSENKGMNVQTAAKAFLTEKDLLDSEPKEPRKGLEPLTGGGQQTPEPGISNEEAEDLRKTNFRKYERLIREGKIK